MPPPGPTMYYGTISDARDKFGFIKPDDPTGPTGEEEVFVIPPACTGFGRELPPAGTRVQYDFQSDPKTGRLRADNVCLEPGAPMPEAGSGGTWGKGGKVGKGGPCKFFAKGSCKFGAACLNTHDTGQLAIMPPPTGPPPPGSTQTGTIAKIDPNGKFGFIKMDLGGPDMFVVAGDSCEAFGREIPTVGTPVQFEVIPDNKTGRLKAEQLRPAQFSPAPAHLPQLAAPPAASLKAQMDAAVARGDYVTAGQIQQQMQSNPMQAQLDAAVARGDYITAGEIQKQMQGPGQIASPMLSTRQPLVGGMALAGGQLVTFGQAGADAGACEGSVVRVTDNGQFGFIKQDRDPQTDMFLLPQSCEAYGNIIPPVGTRIRYRVQIDDKTGKPRAYDVVPSDSVAPAPGAQPGADMPVCMPSAGYGWGGPGLGVPTSAPTVSAVAYMPYGANAAAYATPFYTGPHPAAAPQAAAASVPVSAPWPGPPPTAPPASAMAAGPPRVDSTAAVGVPLTGTFASSRGGNFGFIKQDSDPDHDMFVPAGDACVSFGRELPPVGTRVQYVVVKDSKTGRPRAESVVPLVADS